MNRRSFFQRTFGAVAAVVAARFVPTPVPAPTQALRFHPDAFALAMDDEEWGPPVPTAMRMDVLYGFGTIRSEYVCRIES